MKKRAEKIDGNTQIKFIR